MAGTTKSAGTNPASVPRQGNLSPHRHQSAPTAPVQTTPPPKTRTDTDPESLQQNQTTSGAAKYTKSNAPAAPLLSDLGQRRNPPTPLTPAQTMPHANAGGNLKPGHLQLNSTTSGLLGQTGANAHAKVSAPDLPS